MKSSIKCLLKITRGLEKWLTTRRAHERMVKSFSEGETKYILTLMEGGNWVEEGMGRRAGLESDIGRAG